MSAQRDEQPERGEGAIALVTGAASGIGRASAELLGERGFRVAAADLDDSALPGSGFEVDVAEERSVAELAVGGEARARRAAGDRELRRLG